MSQKQKKSQRKPSRAQAARIAAQQEEKAARQAQNKQRMSTSKKIFISVICAILAIAMTIPSLIMLFGMD
ncbi:MAG: hypothetical protein IJJ14_05670 [Coriobacteriales bacterium]|nr:hypothetical protein [Coriobacteriales bacterium]MBQ6585205.1 hypothetical protein [Coriobacteriales bacterium]